jgi:hypothetical protein
MTRIQVAGEVYGGLHVWRVTVKIFNTQSQAFDKGWSSCVGFVRELTSSETKCYIGPRVGNILTSRTAGYSEMIVVNGVSASDFFPSSMCTRVGQRSTKTLLPKGIQTLLRADKYITNLTPVRAERGNAAPLSNPKCTVMRVRTWKFF